MSFTFGIVTGGGNDNVTQKAIESIRTAMGKKEHEIITVGPTKLKHLVDYAIPFNEHIIPGWITRKKNIITTAAKHENIVYMHDYFGISEGWLKAFEGLDFKIAMTQIKYATGSRFRDWSLDACVDQFERQRLLPYDVKHLSKIMYISGGYWVAKRDIMLEYPLDERRRMGWEEDIEWSHTVRERVGFTMAYHPESYAICLKANKDPVFKEMDDNNVKRVKELTEDQINELYRYSRKKHLKKSRHRHLPCYGCGRGNDRRNKSLRLPWKHIGKDAK